MTDHATQYRFYSFVNHFYMSEKQWGIQTTHGVSTLMAEHMIANPSDASFEERREIVHAWATLSPTVIMCEGGNVAQLLEMEARAAQLCGLLNFPMASFREDMQSLNGAITCVCLIVPDWIFELDIQTDANGERILVARDDATADFSSIDGGLPLTAESHPALHELALMTRGARMA